MKNPAFTFFIALIIASFCYASCKKNGHVVETINETIKAYKISDQDTGGFAIADVSFLDKNTGFIATGFDFSAQCFFTLKTTDGGEHWQKIPVLVDGVTAGLHCIRAITKDMLYATYGTMIRTNNEQGVCMSKDGGLTWSKLSTLPGHTMGLWFLNTNKGFVCNGRVNKTEDGGASWQEMYSTNSMLTIGQVFFKNDTTGYAYGGFTDDYGSSGILIKTTDGGKTWKENSLRELITSIDFTDANTGYALTYENKVYKTTDGAEHWTLLNDRLQGLYFVSAVNGNTKYFTSSREVYKTDDDFKTFSVIYTITDSRFQGWTVAARPEENTTYLFTERSVIKITSNN
ncbi:WD40/YVTN/BNR-like repeat-containing protein [Pinibacter aurantiacus]|uniref:Photosynthesis system II assembly factor Ycf48/Hcf136-like domain-containing protein n=1 Tax=Pinibacter aurantiacus TaxID=2851599 RepID=A0A9E2S827_9BACT|nr:hypothetical protein [Pinibacter aurantiacus]MBV4357342.1 hypothetical protein [Pinibacter aurantiacus]